MREGRKLSAFIIRDERCGERRVLLGGVTKFHERVSPLRPAFARECEQEKRSLVRARERDRNVLGSARCLPRVYGGERERERESKGTIERIRERKTEKECKGRKRKRCGVKSDPPSSRVFFVIAFFSRERERPVAETKEEEKGVRKRNLRKNKKKKERNK